MPGKHIRMLAAGFQGKAEGSCQGRLAAAGKQAGDRWGSSPVDGFHAGSRLRWSSGGEGQQISSRARQLRHKWPCVALHENTSLAVEPCARQAWQLPPSPRLCHAMEAGPHMMTRSAAVSVSPSPPTWEVSRKMGMVELVWNWRTRASRSAAGGGRAGRSRRASMLTVRLQVGTAT